MQCNGKGNDTSYLNGREASPPSLSSGSLHPVGVKPLIAPIGLPLVLLSVLLFTDVMELSIGAVLPLPSLRCVLLEGVVELLVPQVETVKPPHEIAGQVTSG